MRSSPMPGRRVAERAALSRTTALVVAAAGVLAAIVLGVAILLARREPPTAAPGGEPATGLTSGEVREHQAELLWLRAQTAAAEHRWRAARKHLDKLTAEYADTWLWVTQKEAIAALSKEVQQGPRPRPTDAPSREARQPTAAAELEELRQAVLSGKLRLAGTLEGHEQSILALAVSPDGRRIASAGNGDGIRLWDTATGKCLMVEGRGVAYTAVAFAPEGEALLCCDTKGMLTRWNLAKRGATSVDTGNGPLVAMALHGDEGLGRNAFLATVAGSGAVKLWYAENLRLYRELGGPRVPLRTVDFSPDGTRLALAGDAFALWHWVAQEKAQPFEGHEGQLSGAAFLPHGRQILAGGRSLRLWDAVTGKQVETIAVRGDRVKFLAVSPLGDRVVVGAGDPAFSVRHISKRQPVDVIQGHDKGVTCAAWFPAGLRLATAGHDRAIRLWSVGPPGRLELRALDDAWRKRVQAGLKQPVQFACANHPIGTVVEALSGKVDIPVVLHGAAITNDVPNLTLTLEGAPLREALDAITRAAGLAWRIHDGAVLITVPQFAEGEPFPPAEVTSASPLTAASHRIWAAMLKPVTFDFVETPIQDVIAFTSGLTDTTMVLDTEAVRERMPTVTLRVHGMRTDRALRWVCRLSGLAFSYRDEAIFVSTPARLEATARRRTQRRPRLLEAGADEPEPPDARAARRLARPISFDFVETPLQDVLAFIARLNDVTIVLDPEAARHEAPTVTLRVNDMRGDRALGWVCKVVALDYAWYDGAFFVSERATLQALRSEAAAIALLQESPGREPGNGRWGYPPDWRGSFDLTDAPLKNALPVIAEQAGTPIRLDPRLEGEALPPLTLRVTEGRFPHALEWVCLLTGTLWVRDGEGFLVTRPEHLDTPFHRERAWRKLARPKDEEAAAVLARTITFDFVETPLPDVLALLSSLTDIPTLLDPNAVRGKQPTVTLRVDTMPIDQALRWVCRLDGLVYIWHDSALFVTTWARAQDTLRQAEALRPRQQPPEAFAEAMARPVALDFVELPLPHLLGFLRQKTDLPITLDAGALPEKPPTVTLRTGQMRTDHVLSWVCRLAGLAWVWRDGKIVVTPRPPAPRRELDPPNPEF